MEAVLQLLQSEDRSKRLLDQKAMIRKALERINSLIREQMDLQSRNLGGDDPKPLSAEQGGLAKQTGNLSKDIRENEEKYHGNSKGDEKKDGKNDGKGDNKEDGKKDGKSQPGDGKKSDKSSDKEPGKSDGKSSAKPDAKDAAKSDKDGAKSDGKKSDGKQSDGKQSDGKSKPGEGDKSQAKGEPSKSDSQSQSKSKGKSQQGKGQGEGQGQDQDQDSNQPQQAQDQNSPPQQESPVRKRLQAAEENMKKAQEKLDKAKREGAAEEQEKALENLRTAKAELEEILRQLREEEMKRLLAMLEARMQKVLAIQREIYDGTVRLDKVPVPERSHGHEIESGRLSTREDGITQDVKQALSLLREEGSAVAMPAALEQVRDDMMQLIVRLAQGKTEVLTQAIETDVINELEEIVDALKKAQKDIDKKKKPQSSSQNGQPQDPPLIETLSELKMIRSMQMRVNRRTERYSKLVEGEQANKADVFEALQRLAEQQKQVRKITHDLEMGKNE